MLDIKFVRENPDVVKENIRKKFQDQKIPMVDEVIALDQENRNIKQEVESLRANKNKISKQIGALMAQGKKEEAEEVKKEVAASGAKIDELSAREKEVEEKIKTIMMTIPNIIDPSVPVGKDDSENVEIERFGEPVVPDYEVPYHAEIMESFDGLDLDSARKVAAEYTFFLAIPVMFGASFLKLIKFGLHFTGTEVVYLLLGMVVAFGVSIAAIKFLMGYIKKHDFKVFGWYRIALGVVVLAYFLLA